MKTRVLSGLIMLPFGILIFLGGKVLMLTCFAIGIMGVREFFNGFKAMEIRPAYIVAYVSALALYGVNLFTAEFRWYMLWFFGAVLLSLLYLFKIEERKLEDAMATITGIFYVVFFSFHVTLVEQTGEYGILVWLIFLTAFGTDVMAYFTGYAFGKHKLCPTISPKKTIEGSIGGILGSVILCGLFGYILIPRLLIHCIIIGVLGGVVSQFGDLTASIFKRKMGIKDYGNLIPGHGGILDRFDSVLFTAPMIYYYISLVL
ncbi:phosphatidate cytidylyltransferase [Aminipila sp.]|uniref:phosphatidate cytidylyltransferase n=1 Tax=Aminipila sp. TaxID=2060095 RepID=UPI00289CBFBE|nr:phosphatidate cytidylyltransferase [Aminipila sp.]